MKKLPPLIILMWMVLLVINADQARETSGKKVNNSFITTACGGSTNCLIRDDLDDVAEFQMNSDGARMLSNVKKAVTESFGIKERPVVSCPKSTRYSTSCLPPPSGKPRAQRCGVYTRTCRLLRS